MKLPQKSLETSRHNSNMNTPIKISTNDDDDDNQVVLPGFRFHPTDEELVGFYLRRKVDKKSFNIDQLIKHLDIYKYDPWDLPKVSAVDEKEWYFFCIRGRKYRNSIRPNRVTGSGFWKATGIDKPICSITGSHQCIGLKKSLVYYRGFAGKGTKTDWMMHEFRLPPATPAPLNTAQEAEVWTLCRIFRRVSPYKNYIPELKDSMIKQKTVNSSSKTYSLESDITEQYVSFGESVSPTNHSKSNINQLGVAHFNPLQAQAPFTSSIWNPNGVDLFRDGSWDDLRSVVGLSVGSYKI